jgi:16S rRNA processing protein RimM
VEAELDEGEWIAADLTGCEVAGLGRVARVVAAPSCPLLELESGMLVPFVSDAIRSVDVDARRIEVDVEWLG